MSLALRTLHSGPLVRVLDCRCEETSFAYGAEEHVEATHLVLPRTGHFVRRVGTNETALEAGGAAVFVAGESHRIRHPLGCGDRCTVLVPTERIVDRLADSTRGGPTASRLASTIASTLASGKDSGATLGSLPLPAAWLHARLVRAAERRTADPLAIEEAAITLLDGLATVLYRRGRGRGALDSRVNPAGAARRRRIALEARAMLADRLGDAIDLATIADALDCSPFHLCRVFHAETGTTLARHRLALRCLAALDRIQAGAGDLTRLALDLGFADHAHLTNSFRRAFGSPPSAARDDVTREDLVEASKRLQARPAARE